MALDHLGDLSDKEILVLGAGEVGQGVATSLAKLETGQISFINRNFDRANDLASQVGADAVPYQQLGEQLVTCDVLLTSTASDSYLLDHALFEQIMENRVEKRASNCRYCCSP